MRTVPLVAAILGLALAAGCTPRIDRQAGDAAPAGSASPTAASSGATATAAPSTPAARASTPVPASRRCRTDQLRAEVDLIYPAGQAGSEQDAMLGLTNNAAACTMYGYPSVQLLDENGKSRPTKVIRTDDRGRNRPTEFTLQHGQTAWSLIAWGYLPSADEADSQPLCGGKVFQARITPPRETAGLTIGTAFGTVCAHGAITVQPMSLSRPQP